MMMMMMTEFERRGDTVVLPTDLPYGLGKVVVVAFSSHARILGIKKIRPMFLFFVFFVLFLF